MTSSRILFVELWRLGDAVSATAGLRSLRLARPDATIAVVAHSFHGDPLFRSSEADARIPFDAFWTRGKLPRDKYVPWTIDYRALVRVARAVRSFRPDHVLLFRGDAREQLFFSALAPGRVTDLDGPHSWIPGVKKYQRPRNVPRWQEYVSHVQQWTGTEAASPPAIAKVMPARAPREYILIHPGASWRFKRWSSANVARLVTWLRELGHRVRLVAGPEDRVLAESLSTLLEHSVEFEFPTLEQLYSLIAGARLVICNNSAALHIAEAIGTPCLALTGPSHPITWGTYRYHSRTLVKSVGFSCHPCGEKVCVRPEAPCMDEIRFGDVIQSLTEMGVENVVTETTCAP